RRRRRHRSRRPRPRHRPLPPTPPHRTPNRRPPPQRTPHQRRSPPPPRTRTRPKRNTPRREVPSLATAVLACPDRNSSVPVPLTDCLFSSPLCDLRALPSVTSVLNLSSSPNLSYC